jgi:hypothetical protein
MHCLCHMSKDKSWFQSTTLISVKCFEFLPERIKSSTSVNSLKSNLKSNHPQKPPYYYIGKRLGQILQPVALLMLRFEVIQMFLPIVPIQICQAKLVLWFLKPVQIDYVFCDNASI